jgi:hypothetical protein
LLTTTIVCAKTNCEMLMATVKKASNFFIFY